MNWPVLIPLLIAVVGWFAAHRLAAARDRQNKRRELRVTLLLEAFRALEFAAFRVYDKTSSPAIERAFSDIQLLGTPDQVAIASEVISSFARTQTMELTSLLDNLRSDLRKELGLEPVALKFTHLRFKPNTPPEDAGMADARGAGGAVR